MKLEPKNTKTKKILISVMSTAALLAACAPEAVEEGNKTSYEFEKESTVKVWDDQAEETKEVELEHLQDRYPGIDLDAMEDYFEEQGIEYNEEELIASLDEYEETGEVSENSHYSSFPWYLFLLSNVGGKHHSSKNGVVTSPKTTKPSVTTPKTTTPKTSTTTTQPKQSTTTTKPKTNTSTNSTNTNKIQSSSSSKKSTSVSNGSSSSYKSGFGSSSSRTGS